MWELIILGAIQVACWLFICIYRSYTSRKINQPDIERSSRNISINLPTYEEEPLPIYKRYENGSNPPPEYTLPTRNSVVQEGTLPTRNSSVQHIIII